MNPFPCTVQVGDTEETAVLRCTHEDVWPPVHAKLGQSFENMRAGAVISNHKYEQLKTWERTCGLMEMSADKCPACPLALREDRFGTLQSWGAQDPSTRKSKRDWAKPPPEVH